MKCIYTFCSGLREFWRINACVAIQRKKRKSGKKKKKKKSGKSWQRARKKAREKDVNEKGRKRNNKLLEVSSTPFFFYVMFVCLL